MNIESVWAWLAVNWLSLLPVFIAAATLVLTYLQIRKPRWRKYRCRRLPYERIFPGEYGFDPQTFLKDIRSVDLAFGELIAWYADGKALLLRGVTGVGKSRLVTEFVGGLGFWHRLRTRVLMPTLREMNEGFPPILARGCILFLNDLHDFRDNVPDYRLRSYAEDRKFKVVATIPSEKCDSNWSVLSGSTWRTVEVEKWKPEEGRRLAGAGKTVFRPDSFTGTPLSVIAPAAEMKRSYERLACDRKAALEALKIMKIHLGCFADYGFASRVPVPSGRFDESAFTDVIAKQRFWCKTEGSTAMLADGMEGFVDYGVTVEDAYKLEIVLTSEESALKNRPEYLFYLGNRFRRIGENRRALKCYDLSIKLDSRRPSPWLFRGAILRDLGSNQEALYSYSQASNRFEKLGDQSGIAATLHQLAMIEQDKGNYREAKKLYDEVKATFEKLGDQSGIAKTLGQLAVMEQDKGNYDVANRLCNESLTISRKLGDQSGIAATLHQLAMIEQLKDNYPEAKKLYNESLTIKRKLGDQSGIAKTLHNVAAIEQDKGNYREAKKLYDEVKATFEKLGDQSGIGATLHHLAMIEQDKGNYPEAKKLYNESLTIKRKLGNQSGIAATLGQLAIIEQEKGNYREAKKLYDEVKATFEKLGNQSGIATVLHQLAMIEQHKGNYPEAKKIYDQSLEIARKLGDQSGIAATLHQLATIEYSKGNYDQAKKLYNESLTIKRKLGNQSKIATTLGQLGRLAEREGDLESAEKYSQEALEIFERLGEKSYANQVKKDLKRTRRKRERA